MNILCSLVRWIYGLADSTVETCDVVVALGYGLTRAKKLPDAELKVLRVASSLAKQFDVSLAICNSTYFFPGCETVENEQKIQFLSHYHDCQKGEDSFKKIARPISVNATSSVTEATEFKKVAPRTAKNIVIVLDWPHARSARLIWRKVFPEAKIMIKNIEGHWDDSIWAFFQKSELRWIIACLLRHAALMVLGIERAGKIRHPIGKQ